MVEFPENWQWVIYWLGTTMDGQSADCIVVHWDPIADNAERTVVVIDAGKGQDDLDLLLRTLREDVGSTHIDYLIGTHSDNDHVGNFKALIDTEDVTVGTMWFHRPQDHKNVFLEHEPTVVAASARDIQTISTAELDVDEWVHPEPGHKTHDGVLTVLGPSIEYYRELLPSFLDYADIEILQASASLALDYASPKARATPSLDIVETWDKDQLSSTGVNGKKGASNNSSLIMMMQLPGGRQVLFTGDAGVEAFERATQDMDDHGFDPFKLRYFQLAHHGSWGNTNTKTFDRVLGPILGETQATARYDKKTHQCFVMAGSADKHHPSSRVLNAAIRRGWRPLAVLGTAIRVGTLDSASTSNFTTGGSPITPVPFQPNPGN